MKRSACLIALLSVFTVCHFAAAQIPRCLSYQGTLRTGGRLVTGDHSVTFRIYTTGGTLVRTETINPVRFSQGVFTVLLGAPPAPPLDLNFDVPYLMGISIDSNPEISPRFPLCTSPYSFNANAVLGNTSTSNVFRTTGNVGIGTLTPAGKLHIDDTEWSSAPLLVKSRSGGVVGPAITMDATDGTSGRKYSLISTNSGAGGGAGKLAIYDDTPSTGGYRFVLDADGDIGIGTTNPTAKLQVVGSSTTAPAISATSNSSNGIPGATIRAINTGSSGIAGYFETNGADGTMALSNTGTGVLLKGFGANGGEDEFRFNNDGTLMFFDASFVNTIKLSPTTGRTTTKVLEITGGSDLSEQFEVNHANEANSEAAPEQLQPGMVVSIDAQNPGKLVVCSEAYDRKVAGIISGAGGIATGMLMGQHGSEANGATPVALAGRVYCRVDASFGVIEPGDLLTTSDTPGHAMKVTNHVKSPGAIIGKAMTGLAQGKGLVLVLVTLQ